VISRRTARLSVVVVVVAVGAAAGCGGANRISVDQQHEQRIAGEAAGYRVTASCRGASCGLSARARLHSRHEATLIGRPILVAWATDPSLSSVRHASLHLSDTRTGARLTVSCRLADAQKVPPHRHASRPSASAAQRPGAPATRAERARLAQGLLRHLGGRASQLGMMPSRGATGGVPDAA
jgi:hypothetical protein